MDAQEVVDKVRAIFNLQAGESTVDAVRRLVERDAKIRSLKHPTPGRRDR
jgi:hypothetical protein